MLSLSLPPPSARPVRPADLEALLSDHERDAYEVVLKHFQAEEAEMEEGDRFWLTRECIIRYLRGSKWHPAHTVTRIEATLAWRREVGVDGISAEDVEAEAICGKALILGCSKTGQPLFYITPSKRDTEPSEKMFRHIVWMWERCGDLMGPGVETVVSMVNFAGKSKRPPSSLTHKILNAMTHHYPCRTGSAHVLNTPFVLQAFLTLIWPFIDSDTKSRIDTKGKVLDKHHIEPEVLLAEFGGELEFEYKHTKYYPYLAQLCTSRRAAAMQRFRALGGRTGTSEWDLKVWEEAEAKVFGEDVKTAVGIDGVAPVVDCIY